MKDLTFISDKEIQYNIMLSLMRMEGHLSDLLTKLETVEYIDGGDIDEPTIAN